MDTKRRMSLIGSTSEKQNESCHLTDTSFESLSLHTVAMVEQFDKIPMEWQDMLQAFECQHIMSATL